MITPLFVLGIDDLEKIAPHLDRIALHKILEDRWRKDKELAAPFFAVENRSLPKAGSRISETAKMGIDIVAAWTAKSLFGRSFEQS